MPSLTSEKLAHKSSMSLAGYGLIFIAFFFFSLGCVFIFNVSSAEALDVSATRAVHSSLVKQLIFAGSGALLGYFAWSLGVKTLWKHMDLVLALTCLALILCFVPGIGLKVNGSSRWIGFAGYYLQPSEFAKFIIPLFALKRFCNLAQDRASLTWKKVLIEYSFVVVPLGLIIIEPDNRSTILSCSGVIVACFLSRLPVKFWLIPMLVFGSVVSVVALQLPYVQRRLEVFLNPTLDTSGKGYQPYQAKITAGSGGLRGKGLGEGMQKFSYLPEAQNDYIVAIIGEELGFLGVACVISLYAALLVCGYWIACRSQDQALQLVAGVILYMIGIQVFINLGVVSGLLPSTGLNLPFISQGGSSLWACTFMLALLLDVDSSRKTNVT